jgi:hypothetical protein
MPLLIALAALWAALLLLIVALCLAARQGDLQQHVSTPSVHSGGSTPSALPSYASSASTAARKSRANSIARLDSSAGAHRA